MIRAAQYLIVALTLCGELLLAAQLDPASWSATGPDAKAQTELKDNDAGTAAIIKGEALESFSLVIDLKKPRLVYRIYLTSGRSATCCGGAARTARMPSVISRAASAPEKR